METGITFTSLVLGIGALHLIWRAAEFLGIQSGRTRSKTKRSDWYLFFHRSDLTGTPDQGQARNRQDTPRVDSGAKRKAGRPRLRI